MLLLTTKQAEKPNANLFEYREPNPRNLKKKKIRTRQESGAMLDGDPREFKVRIIEKLSFIERKLNEGGSGSGQKESDGAHEEFDIERIQNLSEEVLDTFGDEYLQKVITLALQRLQKEMPPEEVS